MRSLPARGARVEIAIPASSGASTTSRSPQGERGLKSIRMKLTSPTLACRSPQGERGLKYRDRDGVVSRDVVAPHKGSEG